MTEPKFRIVTSHSFDVQTDACWQCRRGRLQIMVAGPVDCDGEIIWREWLTLSPTPLWRREPVRTPIHTDTESGK